MNSKPRSESTAALRGGALAGALFGAVEARWALPPVETPLLSSSEWWMTWFTAVTLGASVGLLAGLLVRTVSGGRGGQRVTGLAIGLAVAAPLFLATFLRLRPRFGPDGRDTTLLISGVIALVVLLLPVLLDRRERRRWLLGPGLLLASLATLGGLLLSLHLVEPSEPASGAPPSLLLITLDTSRADHLPPGERFLEDGGFLRELQRSASSFSALSAPIPLTGPSHASLLSGLPPRRHGAQDNGWKINDEFKTLAERLREHGYATGAVLSAAVLHRELCGLDRGFDEYDDSFRPSDPLRRIVYVAATERLFDLIVGRATGLSHQRRARETVDIGLRFLRRHQGRPYFLWLHFYDPHAPYEPLGPLPSREALPPLAGDPVLGDDDWDTRRAYAGEIRDLDRQLSRLQSEMEELGLLSSTLQVVVTDHGESFGNHGRDYRFDHGAYLFEDELMLGAWWREPGARGGIPITESYGMNALGAALGRRLLSEASGLRNSLSVSPGFSLSHSTVAGDTLWFALRRPDRKLLVGRTTKGSLLFEAYDLARDPQEQAQLLVGRMPPSQSMTDSLGAWPIGDWIQDEDELLEFADGVQRSLDVERPELSDAARERLRSLGYIR